MRKKQLSHFTLTLKADGSLSGNPEMERYFLEQVEAMFKTFCRKQKSYGRGNISAFGEKGILVRLSDKTERLKRMVWKEVQNPLNDESIDDTWSDIAVYAVIALMVRKGLWL